MIGSCSWWIHITLVSVNEGCLYRTSKNYSHWMVHLNKQSSGSPPPFYIELLLLHLWHHSACPSGWLGATGGTLLCFQAPQDKYFASCFPQTIPVLSLPFWKFLLSGWDTTGHRLFSTLKQWKEKRWMRWWLKRKALRDSADCNHFPFVQDSSPESRFKLFI